MTETISVYLIVFLVYRGSTCSQTVPSSLVTVGSGVPLSCNGADTGHVKLTPISLLYPNNGSRSANHTGEMQPASVSDCVVQDWIPNSCHSQQLKLPWLWSHRDECCVSAWNPFRRTRVNTVPALPLHIITLILLPKFIHIPNLVSKYVPFKTMFTNLRV